MMNLMHTVRAWRQIEGYLSLISDPFLAAALRHEFAIRAKNEWGYCPGETQTHKDDNDIPDLTEEEQRLVDIINANIDFSVDVRTDEEKHKLYVTTLNNMIDFVNRGGTYWEIPETIRCDSLKAIYDKAFNIVFNIKG